VGYRISLGGIRKPKLGGIGENLFKGGIRKPRFGGIGGKKYFFGGIGVSPRKHSAVVVVG
jgi:hypothetical protein